jgi:hypothetical protein
MSDCDHEKVYSGERNLTCMPQWFWICAKCKAIGTDSLAQTPPLDFDRFVLLMAEVDPEGAAAVGRMRKRR